jgi:hypothetical protein
VIAQGLLIQDHTGEDYLLTTQPREGTKAHQLVVLQKIDGEWRCLKDTQEPACRESLIGAFVDFFVDLCRVLNSSSLDRSPTITSASGGSGVRSSAQTKHKRER